nr:site-specific integrase [Marinobacterium jannaschii]
MRQMFRFAVDRDLISVDPTANIRKVNIGGKDTERDRILAYDEIQLLETQIPSANLRTSTEVAVWITLSTCCRIGELLNAQWKHIDPIKREWLIPAENSKNGKAHTVYLSDFTANQFDILHSINSDSPWCYPNRSKTGPVSTKTITKQLTDRQRSPESGVMSNRSAAAQALLLPGGKWTPHDLRRTGASMMVALGVLPEVAERCLNHTEENKVKRIYQRYSYAAEMAEAWEVLGDKLSGILLTSQSLRTTTQADTA